MEYGKILLIDADSKIPNLALMKLSAFYKLKGYHVDLMRLAIPYYPTRKKLHNIYTKKYEKVYCSIIYTTNANIVNGDNIIYGGTGYDYTVKLPDDIENIEPDYSIYPYNNTSYGFITRGCIRNCYFCFVPKKEGMLRKVNDVSRIVKHDKVVFLDNNILAYDGHKDILKEIINIGVKCNFNQGFDIRLLDEENSHLISQLKYFGDYCFAFDDYGYINIINEKKKLLQWAKPYTIKFFAYVHPDMDISNIILRIRYLKENKFLCYVMRDIKCYESEHKDFYTDIAAYTNQVGLYKKLDFIEFVKIRHTCKERIAYSIKMWNSVT